MLADKTLSALVFSLSYDRNIWLYYLLILCYLLCLSIINLEIFFSTVSFCVLKMSILIYSFQFS